MWNIEWTTTYIISQIIALIAVIFGASTYLIKNKKIILFNNIIALLFYTIEYAILGAWTASVATTIGIIRTIWFFINEKNNKTQDKLSLIIIFVVTIIGGIFTYDGILSILPVIGNVIFTYGLWQKNILGYRICAFATDCLYLGYNIYVQTLIGTIFQIIMVVVGIIGIIIYFTKQHKSTINVN